MTRGRLDCKIIHNFYIPYKRSIIFWFIVKGGKQKAREKFANKTLIPYVFLFHNFYSGTANLWCIKASLLWLAYSVIFFWRVRREGPWQYWNTVTCLIFKAPVRDFMTNGMLSTGIVLNSKLAFKLSITVERERPESTVRGALSILMNFSMILFLETFFTPSLSSLPSEDKISRSLNESRLKAWDLWSKFASKDLVSSCKNPMVWKCQKYRQFFYTIFCWGRVMHLLLRQAWKHVMKIFVSVMTFIVKFLGFNPFKISLKLENNGYVDQVWIPCLEMNLKLLENLRALYYCSSQSNPEIHAIMHSLILPSKKIVFLLFLPYMRSKVCPHLIKWS